MTTAEGKTKRRSTALSQERPALARVEVVDARARARFQSELATAMKRKPSTETPADANANGSADAEKSAERAEAKLAGALRAVGGTSRELRAALAETAATFLRKDPRAARDRQLYISALRTVSEGADKASAALLKAALSSDDAGGLVALSCACFSRDASLAPILAKLAVHRQSHVAFGAELARVARGESNGAHLAQLAPMIKESHRIALCAELFVPLARGAALPIAVAPALAVLRGAERHLGRWLPMAEIATRAGDTSALVEAETRSKSGPESARAAWSLVAWALRETSAPAAVSVPLPATRPTAELVARLSDRPSADRDMTFLFRLARARVPVARPMLEALAKEPLDSEVAIRAAMYLARDHGRADLLAKIDDVARGTAREGAGADEPRAADAEDTAPAPATVSTDPLRGLACAALWDAGDRERAREIAEALGDSPIIGNVAWSIRVRAAAKSPRAVSGELASESWVRWIQWGWLE